MSVRIEERNGLGLATVMARKGKADALAARIRERFGIELPRGPRRAASGDLALVGTGPEAWLAVHEKGSAALMPMLRDLADLAAISDQSDGYAVWLIAGAGVREVLAKLVFVDLHPSTFAVGQAAITLGAHMTVTLWRADDGADGSSFELAVYRSYANDVLDALSRLTGRKLDG